MASDQSMDEDNGMTTTGTSSPPISTLPCTKSNPKAQFPQFPMLVGEYPILLSKTVDGNAMVTNFRLCMCERRSFINLPLLMIGEAVVVVETIPRLKLSCKDGSTYICTFATSEDCRVCMEVLKDKISIPSELLDIFAFHFFREAIEKASSGARLSQAEMDQIALCQDVKSKNSLFDQEVLRLGFDTNMNRIWKMSHANENFEFCPTYPKLHILPATVDDEKLKECTDFRAGKRFPSVVWRDCKTGVVLIRSSQPLASFLGLSYFSNEADVFLLEEIVKACTRERDILSKKADSSQEPAMKDKVTATNQRTPVCSGRGDDLAMAKGPHRNSPQGSPAVGPSASPRLSRDVFGVDGASPCETPSKHPLAIVDCRSRAMIWGNSFKGGGTEDEAKYKCNIIQLDLPNIHTVRDSFFKLRSLCYSYVDGSYYKSLSGCMWLSYISALLRGANIVVELMYVEKRPVLVHCSDGWDRTTQICSLAELLMDPYYRTIKGFQVLVQREWLQFGHKFGERGGYDPHSSDVNQQSPVFLQFLDCVYQLTLQYPAEFQFNEAYLVKLLKHSQACLFGTFLHNSEKERQNCPYRTASLWALLTDTNSQFVNLLYSNSKQVLKAHCGEHNIVLWKSVYMAGLSSCPHSSQPEFCFDQGFNSEMDEEESPNSAGAEAVSRSRSMDDLSKINTDNARRNSDPNIAQSPDTSSSTISPAINAAAIHDTSSSSAEIIPYPGESPPSGSSFNSCDTGPVLEAMSKDKDGLAKIDGETSMNENVCEDNVHCGGSHGCEDNVPSDKPLQDENGAEGQDNLGHSDNMESNTTNILTSTSSSIVRQDDGTSVTTSSVEKNSLSEEVTNSALSNGISSSEATPVVSPTVSDPVVLGSNHVHFCNGHTSDPNTDCTVSSDTNNGSGSDAKSRMGVQDSKTISLLSERLAEDEDRKQRVVNGIAVSASPSTSEVNGRSPSTSSSTVQHSPKTFESDKDLNSDERKILQLKTIAQETLKTASKTLTASHSSDAVTTRSKHLDSDGDKSKPKSDKVQPIPINSRKANGYTLNGDHKDPGVDQGTAAINNTISTDTLVGVGDLDDALYESPPMTRGSPLCVPYNQTLGIETGDSDNEFFSTSSTLSSRKDSNRTLLPAKGAKNTSASATTSAALANKVISRRARTASGASRDLSVSPCYSCGNWTDTGRLRHPSGGESSALLSTRRNIAASVSTSTTDISDSFVGKITPPVQERQSVRQHLDVDSLTLFSDHRQNLLAELVSEKDRKISELESRLSRAVEYIRYNRNRSILHQPQACPVPDDVLQNEPECGEYSSLGTVSNPASDTSWEQVDESEERVVLWVPDEVVTHCAGCDQQFWFYRRKHHCRNCGKIFCFDCRNYLALMPNIYMKEPQRVCRRCHSRLMQLSPGASCDGRIPTLVADG